MKFIKELAYGNHVTEVLRILLGLMFAFSGFFKILDPVEFSSVIAQYDILPLVLVPYAALVFPYLETGCGILLLIGYRIKSTSLVLMFLMTVFTLAVIISVIRGKTFDCGCFQLGRFGLSERVSIWLVLRDMVILGLIILVYNVKNYGISVDQHIEKNELTKF